MDIKSKIYVAGNTGLVGSAICRTLETHGYDNLVFTPFPEYDLTNQEQTREFFARENPEYVFIAAAKVGGIYANSTYPAEFIYTNLMIACNIIHAAYKNRVKKLLFLGSSCIYPKYASQPIKENYLLTGQLEPTNEAYAVAKISGLKLCEYYRRQYGCDFIAAMPTNLYGPGDNFDLQTSHVLPAMIRKFHDAKMNENRDVTLWGTGNPRREFLFVDDLADALLFIMKKYSDLQHINVGSGTDIEIRKLAELVADIVGFKGMIKWDTSKPDGTPRKQLDVTKLNDLGWSEKTTLSSGIERTYKWFLSHHLKEKFTKSN